MKVSTIILLFTIMRAALKQVHKKTIVVVVDSSQCGCLARGKGRKTKYGIFLRNETVATSEGRLCSRETQQLKTLFSYLRTIECFVCRAALSPT